MGKAIIYKVYKNKHHVFTGTATQIIEKLFPDKPYLNVYNYAEHEYLLGGLYRIKFAEPRKKEDEKLMYLVSKLSEHGKTVLSRDPEQYREALREYGIEIDYEARIDGRVMDSLLPPNARNKDEIYYIVWRKEQK